MVSHHNGAKQHVIRFKFKTKNVAIFSEFALIFLNTVDIIDF